MNQAIVNKTSPSAGLVFLWPGALPEHIYLETLYLLCRGLPVSHFKMKKLYH